MAIACDPAGGASGPASPTDPLPSQFREVMASLCTPVSVVTAMAGSLPHGTTVSAFASLSMDPPMVLVSLDRSSELLASLRPGTPFGLNVLSSSQPALARRFACKGGPAKFAGVSWQVHCGVPRLPGTAGFLACAVSDLVQGGDHIVVMGLVHAVDGAAQPPLTYHARVFGTHAALDEFTA